MSEQPVPDYKSTLTITTTEFPQKAGLTISEPARLEHWKEIGLEKLLTEKGRKLGKKYVLHDGPPYANGDIHLGHALNKTLKDIVVRYKTMRGYHAHYVPGYDCHGLPIEQKVIEKLGQSGERSATPLEIRKLCAEYAQKYIGLQTSQFQRLGVGGAWDTPYLTLNPQYEVGILKAFRAMVERGSVERGFKPVYWDTRFRTALAEAEIEYEDHTSPSIYVRFPVLNAEKCAAIADYSKEPGDIRIVIWTTTPWTLPGNLAVSIHPSYDYVLFKTSGEMMICAEYLLEGFAAEAGLVEPHILTRFKGAELEGLECSHPLLDKVSRVILGEHVTLEQGTGCVHTAPGHGVEDFIVCKKYDIKTVVPVDEKGCFNEEYPEMQGEFVWKANPKVIEKLKEKGLLVWSGKIQHQYAYSWRSHEPTIVRATHQWFMKLDHDGIREKCLDAIDNKVQWIPTWGHDRIYNMMKNRPDWCLSRQRSWGVPIPAVFSVKAQQTILCTEIIDKFIEQVAIHGTDCWFDLPVSAFIPEGFKCPYSGGTEFEKEFDILDVWFDSGSSHISVLENDPDLASPADLYLEGSDQHRGWFNSSLVNSMASRDRAPYKAVLTHGFVLDGEGYAMSKSKGNTISPLTIIKDMGADVLRMWVISEDYRNDIRASANIFKQMMEAYRRVRNTLRFLLGNIGDFDPAKNTVPVEKRLELDRWVLAKLGELIDGVTESYEVFEFNRIHHLVQNFCVVTLSAQYLDILKDRLYCSAPDDLVRRSAQSSVWDIFSVLTRLIAPVIPFTADEAWAYGHPAQPSVHLEDFPSVPDSWRDEALITKWNQFVQIREMVMRPMEELRRAKSIGKNLDAAAILRPNNKALSDLLIANQEVLKEFFIVSTLKIETSAAEASAAQSLEQQLEVQVLKASGEKCPRCWTYSENQSADPQHPSLCARCADVVRRLNQS
ncbi:TPA: isoleucine--tRNA ligase [Candidatus Sumerlaeota bacterium]|nr:isoleucine--tRNA ligase [Candidatus Sumerlaeota bacterium]